MNLENPVVSVIVPCRNEVNNISNLIESIFGNSYNSNFIEVLIVDGMSDDGTRELIKDKYLGLGFNIKMFDNIKQKTPYAFNIGIRESTGEIIIILGSRHVISKNYIEEVVECLSQRSDIGCVGGVVINVYENRISEVISGAMSSSFGMGFGNFRTIVEDSYVDTVGSPGFRRSIFDLVGFFDENLTRNQDDDFSYRITRFGYKILLKSSIKVKYVVRSSFYNLSIQFKQYGYWKVFVNRKHKTITTFRQVIPLMFLLSLSVLVLLSFFSLFFKIVLFCELLLYFGLSLFFAFQIHKFRLIDLIMHVYSCLIIHISYAFGYFLGVIDFLILNKKPSKKSEVLSR